MLIYVQEEFLYHKKHIIEKLYAFIDPFIYYLFFLFVTQAVAYRRGMQGVICPPGEVSITSPLT